MKKIFLLFILPLILFCGCSNKDDVNVRIEIDASDILSHYDMLDSNLRDEKYVPENGIILNEVEVSAKEGDSAADVLIAICKENDIHYDISDGYAKGINFIYEKSCGEMSGWIYEINGESIMTDYSVKKGDKITWKYICDFSDFSE